MLVTAVLVVAVVGAVVVMIVFSVLFTTTHSPALQWRPVPHSVLGRAAAFGDLR